MGAVRGWRVAMVAASCTGALVSCSSTGSPSAVSGPEQQTVRSGALEGELVVFAAASLADVFDELLIRFADVHPDVEVVLNLAASQTLAGQLLAGAQADVFAAADPTAMERVVDDGLAASPQPFAGNVLEIVVEPGNPLGIGGLADLAREDVVLVLPAEQAAAGRHALEALRAAAVVARPASLESDPRAATNRVAMGEADAAIVFRTDVLSAGDRVEGVAIPERDNVTARYPIVALEEAPNPAAAGAFVELVRSREGREVLDDAGFTVPP